MDTYGLGFNALPNVFAVMPAGQFFGFVWFFMLFLAAITSSVSMLQPVIAFFEEGLGLRRHASVALLGMVTALGTAFTMYFSKDSEALNTLDFWCGTFLIFTLAMFQTVLYGWIFGIERGHEELHHGANIRVPWFVQLVLKYVAPTYLFVIFATFCWQNLLNKEEHLLDAPTSVATLLTGNATPNELTAVLADAKAMLPDDATLSAAGADGPWTISNADGKPLYRLRIADNDEGQERLRIYSYKLGMIGALAYNSVALMAVAFILTIAAFLMLLIHIAGKRWVRDGRLPAPMG
jgi:hypothetical protein